MAERTPAQIGRPRSDRKSRRGMDVELASARTLGGPAVTASHDARQAMTERVGGAMAVAALAADMPDGRTIAQWLDALAALEAACREAPWIWSRHAEAAAHPGECRLCGHSWPCPSERIRHLLPEARP